LNSLLRERRTETNGIEESSSLKERPLDYFCGEKGSGVSKEGKVGDMTHHRVRGGKKGGRSPDEGTVFHLLENGKNGSWKEGKKGAPGSTAGKGGKTELYQGKFFTLSSPRRG